MLLRHLLIASFAVVASTQPALAGGYSEYRPDPARERLVARWRANPRAAMPDMIRAVCRERDMAFVAQELLEELGTSAIGPLLAAAAGPCRETNIATKLVARSLCRAQAASDHGEVTSAFAPIAAALDSSRWDRIQAALWVFAWMGHRPPDSPRSEDREPDEDHECRAAEPLFVVARPQLARLMRARKGYEREQVVAALARFGRHATPLVAQLIPLLDDEDAQFEAAAVLAGIGPAAAPAAPALARLLARTDNEWRQFAIAFALEQIGPAAAVALPALRARLQAVAAEPCTSFAGFSWFIRVIVGIGPAPDESPEAWRAQVLAAISKALESLRRCDAGHAEGMLIDLLATFPADGAAELVVAILMDEGRSLGRRTRAAKALESFSVRLTKEQEVTRQLLFAHAKRTDAWGPMGQADYRPSRSQVTARSLRTALDRCGGEGEQPAPKPDLRLDVSLVGNEEMSECLGQRLCGPGRERYSRVMRICCRYAYASPQPAWCPR